MKVDIAVFDGMDELDAVGPLEVLRRADFDVHLVSKSSQVTCAFVVFPGGGWVSRAADGVRVEVDGASWVRVIEAEQIAAELDYRS